MARKNFIFKYGIDVAPNLNGIGTVFTINNRTGNIGIGTTNPQAKFHVAGTIIADNFTGNATSSGTADIATYATSAGTATYASNAGIATYASNAGISTSVIGNNASVTLGTTTPTGTASQRLQVTGGAYISGNLGIGTTNPSEKLSVYGAVESLYDTIGEGGQFILRGKTETPIRWNIDNYSTTNLFRIFKEDNSTAGANGRVYVGITTIGEFIIGDGAGALSPTGTANQQLQVQSSAYVSGNLGVGVTNPTSTLQVTGTFYNSGIGTFANGNNTFGTSSASSLELGLNNNSNAGTLKLWGATSNAYGLIQATTSNLHIDTVVGGTYLNYYDGDFVSFGTGAGAESARFTGDTGTLTLGTITPTGTASQRLQVNGGAYVSDNLGVGAINPGEKLQVDGNVRIGVSAFSNYIAFRGTYADDQTLYTHTYVGERIWDPGSERSELLLFKGNDADTFSGPDRIRLAAGQIRIDTYPSGTFVSGTFEEVATNSNIVNRVVVHSTGEVGIGTDVLTGTASQRLQINGGAYVSGNVGIGSAQPTAKLDIIGDTKVSGIISANGFKFPSTQVTSTDANTLDDYEEGTWTPTVVGSSTPGTATYPTQTGQYTKIGNRVFFSLQLNYFGHTGTGDLTITGLPFSSSINTPFSLVINGLAAATSRVITPYVSSATPTTILFLYYNSTDGSITNLLMDDLAIIQISGNYIV